jgi:tetratricopeptide (TPR) repeat protein
MLFLLRFLALALCWAIVGCSSHSPSSTAARVAYYRARAAGPTTYPAYARLGAALLDDYRETGEERSYAEAIAAFEKSLHYQRNADALLGLGMALAEKHQFKRALPLILEAAEAMPENADALAALFDVHLALGNTKSATAVLDDLRKSHAPEFICTTRSTALAEYAGDYQAATKDMQSAARAAAEARLPALKQAWCEVRLGSLRMMVGDETAARGCYKRALELVPDYFFAMEHVGEWHAARGEWAAAERVYRKLLRDHPEPGYRVALAEAVEQQQRSSEAREHLAHAVKELRAAVASGAVDHCRELAALLLCMDESPGEALVLARQDWQLREDIFTADTLALALSANGEHSEAMRLSTALLAVNTNHPALLLHGAIIRLRGDATAEADRLLARAKSNPLSFTTSERKALAQAERLLRTGNGKRGGRWN